MSTYNILILGASYGSLLASKLLFGGHKVRLVCLPAEAELINNEGLRVRLPVKGRRDLIEIDTRRLPGKVSAGEARGVDPREFDLIALAMQEPQYGSVGVRELVGAIAKARVPCVSVMNMPTLPYLRRIPGLRVGSLKPAFTEPSLWDEFDSGTFTQCSPDPQAIRPSGEPLNVLQVTLPTNFKVAQFDDTKGNAILKQLEREVDGARYDGPQGSMELPVKLRFHNSIFVPLAKWPMLVTGNYRCILSSGIRSAEEAVYNNLEESAAVYNFVLELCLKLGASREDVVSFERYASAAKDLSRPSSVARALENGATNVERVDKIVQLLGREAGVNHPVLDEIVGLLDQRVDTNRRSRGAAA